MLLTGILGLILGLGVLLYGLLTLLLLVEVLVALLPESPLRLRDAEPKPTWRILVPAHNEAEIIEGTLSQLLLQVDHPRQIGVIADNCTDQTAELARQMGVQVWERQDDTRRGKGYALAFGLDQLSSHPPEVVVIVDADCYLSPGGVKKIAHQSATLQRPVQAIYRMELPPDPQPRDRISGFAVTVKNQVRAGGLSRMGFPILLGGTGMAFPWQVLQLADLATGNIVEDMKLGIDLTIAGYPPVLNSAVRVIGKLPSDAVAAKSQRTRWEHGHLQTLATDVPRLIQQGVQQRRIALIILAMDLAIPPLALWVMIGVGLTFTVGLLGWFAAIWTPLKMQTGADLLLVTDVLLAWLRWGRHDLSFGQLIAIPLYVIWKIPLYLTAFRRPQAAWVRTERD
ncbi:MAG: glycosyltransferase family 2 protein [Cyanobacteria bacterium]|nr:glycosyltransferase family 2 protein [Cyanobacteriota bacterium]MDA0867430.1 glycosyltransferase family 2 protein [Cyanobacteriota bacterium]